jgi:hypothetical protein
MFASEADGGALHAVCWNYALRLLNVRDHTSSPFLLILGLFPALSCMIHPFGT